MAVALSPVQQDALRSFARAIAAECPRDVLDVRLFGSRARGDAKPWSDVDLLIVVRDQAASDRIHAATAKLRESLWSDDFPGLTCMVLAETDFRRHQAMPSLLYRDLRDQGVSMWRKGMDLWGEEGIAVIGRERDVRFHLQQAGEARDDARVLAEANRFGGAASRAYYAAFRAAGAVLLTETSFSRDLPAGTSVGRWTTFTTDTGAATTRWRPCSRRRMARRPWTPHGWCWPPAAGSSIAGSPRPSPCDQHRAAHRPA